MVKDNFLSVNKRGRELIRRTIKQCICRMVASRFNRHVCT